MVKDFTHSSTFSSSLADKGVQRGYWGSTGLGGSEHPQPGSLSPTLAVSSRAGPAALFFPQFPPRCSGQQLELCSWSGEKGQTTVRLVFIRKS